MDGNAYQVESKVLLGNATTISGKARSSGGDSPSDHAYFVAEVTSDQAGTLFVENCDDVSIASPVWYPVNGAAGTAVTANTTATVRAAVLAPYYRARYTNGATPQTTFRFSTAYASA